MAKIGMQYKVQKQFQFIFVVKIVKIGMFTPQVVVNFLNPIFVNKVSELLKMTFGFSFSHSNEGFISQK